MSTIAHPDPTWGLLDPQIGSAALGPLAHHLPAGLVVLDREGRLLFLNAAAEGLLGSTERLLGRLLADVLPQQYSGALRRLCNAVVADQPLERLRVVLPGGNTTRTLQVSPSLLKANQPLVLLLLDDISEEERAHQRLARLATGWAQRNVHLALLQHPTLDIASQPDLPATLRVVAYRAARLVEADGSAIFLLDQEQGWLSLAAAWGTGQALQGVRLSAKHGLAAEVLRGNQACRRTTASLADQSEPEAQGPLLAVPLQYHDTVSGLLAVFRLPATPTLSFSEDDELLLAGIAAQSALAISNARLFDETRSLARALHSSEARLRAIIDNMPALVYLIDSEQGILLANQGLAALLGFSSGEELIGKQTADLFPPEEAAVFEANIQIACATQDKIIVEETTAVSGQQRHFLSIRFPLRDAVSGALQLGGVAVDITERKQNEERLRQLAALEERAHLARELHDSVTQILFSMSLNARAAERALARDPAQAAPLLTELTRLAQGALAEMRALIFELRPESLESEGLLAALGKHTAALQARHEILVVSSLGVEPVISIGAKEALYRIAQEAMYNVVKHARASQIELALTEEQGEGGAMYRLSIRDDGVGFDADATYTGHLGLVSMRERAARIGATLTVCSQIGQGTTIVVLLPVPPGGEDDPRLNR